MLAASRPTAVNLRWAVERMMRAAEQAPHNADLATCLLAEASELHRETLESDRRLSALGAALIPHGSSVLTHCNTGALATGGYGTALGVVRWAWEEGRVQHVLGHGDASVVAGGETHNVGVGTAGHTCHACGRLRGRSPHG